MFLKIVTFIFVSICITAAIALGMIASQAPKEMAGDAEGGLNFTGQMERGIAEMPEPDMIQMRDGWKMPVRRFGENSDAGKPLMIMIHGSGWNGLQFSHLANDLAGDAHVLVPDLRGHGATPERRGDVDYIGQMEDDIADLIRTSALSGQKVVLVGHSSGGGLVVRFAGGEHRALMSEAVLLAPFLKHDAPMTKPNSGGWAQVLLRRIIGLSMLNSVGITALNHLTIIQFNMPNEVLDGKYGHLATTAYSYRLNTGFAPRSDYLADVAAMPEFLLIAGSQDEAFHADKYEGVMTKATNKGRYHILEGETHLGVVFAPQTSDLIKGFLQ